MSKSIRNGKRNGKLTSTPASAGRPSNGRHSPPAPGGEIFVVDSSGNVSPLDAGGWKVPHEGRALPLNQRFSRNWEIPPSILERLRDENGLRNALNRQELVVFYQPQWNVQTGKIVGAEALVRWEHPVRGLVLPGEFIPLAEETGFVVPLGEWVLRAACSQMKSWQDAGLTRVTVAVNVSPRQFREPNLRTVIERALDSTGLAPEWLEVEITEGTAMENVARSADVLREIADIGVRISIDDFGSGYSSLTYLKVFALHCLKMDQYFVRGVASEPNAAAIAAAILAMARALDLDVIAEGVETEDQLAFFREHGCEKAQGFYLGRPMPADDFAALLKKDSG